MSVSGVAPPPGEGSSRPPRTNRGSISWGFDEAHAPGGVRDVSKLGIFIAALGVAFFLEGLPYFIAPSAVRSYLRQLERLSDAVLRVLGLALIGIGLTVAYLALHFVG